MTAKQWNFNPSHITINEFDKVRLKITSIAVTHGISIPEFGVNKVLQPGQTEIIEFTADKKVVLVSSVLSSVVQGMVV